jgi:hypothetical protein
MKIVSPQKCQDWLKAKLARDFTWETVKAVYPHCVTYQSPSDTGKRTALARSLTGSIDTTESGLFWITAWGIFPSSENMALFEAYRKSLGESRAIQAAPGHIFDESDLEQLECLLDLALYFYWDACLFDGAGSIAARISHDECFSVYAKDGARLQDFERNFGRLKLKQLARSK